MRTRALTRAHAHTAGWHVLLASLCADVRYFGLAQRMGALAAGFLFLLGADWSGALVRPGFAGPWRLVLSQMAPSHIRWGRGRCVRVMGA